MSGPEIVLGIVSLLTPLLVAPIESTLRKRFNKTRYDYYSDREEVCSHFIESWTSLHSSILQLLSIIRTLAHDDQDRRAVLKELERATKIFQDVNTHLLACKPIGNAFREQEKTNMFLETIREKIATTGIITDEKIAAVLGSIIAGKLSSPITLQDRENDTQIPANRGHRNTGGHGNSNFHDEGFFENPQPPQFSRGSPASSCKQDNKHARNAAPYHDCGSAPPCHRTKCRHHNSSSPSPPSSFYGRCSQGSPRDQPPRRENRYHGQD